jgi:hypothetical protein
LKIPRWAGLNKTEKRYSKLFMPEFIKAGTLIDSTMPEFIKLCKNLVRRDEIDKLISEENQSLVQETKFVDTSGQEHSTFKESAYSKMSRDYDRIISQQMKTFRPKPKEKEDEKKEKAEFFD